MWNNYAVQMVYELLALDILPNVIRGVSLPTFDGNAGMLCEWFVIL